jgi:hypothetical protein
MVGALFNTGITAQSGSSGIAQILLGNCVIIDAVNGDDATGVRGRLDKPFLTGQAALEASQNQDTLIFLPGTYSGGLRKFGGPYSRSLLLIDAAIGTISGIWLSLNIQGLGKASILGEGISLDSTDLIIKNVRVESDTANALKSRGNVLASDCIFESKTAAFAPIEVLLFNLANPLRQSSFTNCYSINRQGGANAYAISQTASEYCYINGLATNLPIVPASYIIEGFNTYNSNLTIYNP